MYSLNHYNGSENGLAKLYYKGADYEIIQAGTYVLCAVTGKSILLDDLRYWSVKRQEAYANCQISYECELKDILQSRTICTL